MELMMTKGKVFNSNDNYLFESLVHSAFTHSVKFGPLFFWGKFHLHPFEIYDKCSHRLTTYNKYSYFLCGLGNIANFSYLKTIIEICSFRQFNLDSVNFFIKKLNFLKKC